MLGAFALLTLWRCRRSVALPAWAVRIALVGCGAMIRTGLLGGEMRHTKIRSDFVKPAGHEDSSET